MNKMVSFVRKMMGCAEIVRTTEPITSTTLASVSFANAIHGNVLSAEDWAIYETRSSFGR
jgi:hypothetical protein